MDPEKGWGLAQYLPDIIGLTLFQGSRFKRACPLRRFRRQQVTLVRLVIADLTGPADKKTFFRRTFDFQFFSSCHNRSFR